MAGRPAGVRRVAYCLGGKPSYIVTRSVRSEVFSVKVKETHKRKTQSREELGFPLLRKGKMKFFPLQLSILSLAF